MGCHRKFNKKSILQCFFLYCCALNLDAAPVHQDSISYSAELGGPISTTTADTLAKGELGFSQRIEYYPFTPLSNLELVQNPLAESQNANVIDYFMMFYGLTDNITIGASLPLVFHSSLSGVRFNENKPVGGVSSLGTIFGVGDTNFFSMWRFLEETQYPISLAFLSGINVPTGKTTAREKNGALFAAANQPGSGAWNPLAGIIVSRKFKKFSLSSNLIYNQGTEGTQNTTLGSTLSYNFATVLELYNKESSNYQIYSILELNGDCTAKDIIAGVLDNNSGGHSVFLLPGLRINIHEALSFYLGVNVPLLQNFFGTQVKSQYGLTGGIDINVSSNAITNTIRSLKLPN